MKEIKQFQCTSPVAYIVTGNPARLRNLTYSGNEISNIKLSFNFLTKEVDNQPEFDYNVLETVSGDSSKVIGGELYSIRKEIRYLFHADAGGDKNIFYKDSIQLSASDIGESAYYNWYNEAGKLIFTGKEFYVNPEITQKYKLEVLAESDGFTSYDSLTVNVKEMAIKNISPNPTTNEIQVQYEASKANTAFLLIQQLNSSFNDTVVLLTEGNLITINVSNYQPGSYMIKLICDGKLVDQKTFVKL